MGKTVPAMNLLALDTSTEWMSIAVQRAGQSQPWTHHAPGGALTSTQLIPQIQALMAQAGLGFETLDAIVFGAGPGSFTGLRSACAVAQGLAFGARVPVLPVDTLLAVAEDARLQFPASASCRVTALLDARMDEVYVACYWFERGLWRTVKGCSLMKPEGLDEFLTSSGDDPATLLAGNVFDTYAARLPARQTQRIAALPTASALLRLAPALLAAGAAVSAAQALPTYVRDKVAQTTLERAAVKRADTL
jgi:tRNA threonylcarbamoyladenosine biosynthesis protein TsaB